MSSELLENQLIKEIIELVQEMGESLPRKLDNKNSSSSIVSRSKEILADSQTLYQQSLLSKKSYNNLSNDTKKSNNNLSNTGYEAVQNKGKMVARPVKEAALKELDVRPRIKPITESSDKYVLPDGWENTKFEDAVYQSWRAAMIKSLHDQPDMLTTVPKLFKDLIQADFLN
eukprot:NODE_42_length_29671_cov_0.584810.p13 type:complete len:172 gc:universal NODE_42_length_29671_cov_0.584810:15583-15068(-)